MGALATIALTVALAAPAAHGEGSLVALPNFKHQVTQQLSMLRAPVDSSALRDTRAAVGHPSKLKIDGGIWAVQDFAKNELSGRSCLVASIAPVTKGEGCEILPSPGAPRDRGSRCSSRVTMHPRQPFYASVSYALPGLSPLASLLDSSFYCEGRWIVNNQTASATREMPQHTGPNSDSSSRLPAPLDSRLSVSCRDSHISSQAQTAGQGAGTTFPGTSPFRQIRHPDAALLPPVRHCLS